MSKYAVVISLWSLIMHNEEARVQIIKAPRTKRNCLCYFQPPFVLPSICCDNPPERATDARELPSSEIHGAWSLQPLALQSLVQP